MSDLFLRPLFTWRSAVASKFGPENATTRHVLIFLSLHMSEKGDSCFPSTRTLAEETGLNQRTVVVHLELAERSGWIGRRDHRTNGKGWRKVEYFALIPPSVEAAFHVKQGEYSGSSPKGECPESSPCGLNQDGECPGSNGECPDYTLVSVQDTLSTSVNSTRTKREGGTAAAPTIRKQKKGKTLIPTDFGISEQVRTWSKLHGFEPYLEPHLAYLKDYAASNAVLKADWEATFRNSIRADWGGVRKSILMAAGAGKAAPVQRPWWQTSPGIEQKGRELGVERTESEPFPYFKARVYKAAGSGPWV